MQREFEMSDMGRMKYFLGLEVKQVDGGVFCSQRKYSRDLLVRFGMQNCKVAPPMNANEKLQQEDVTEAADASYYRSLICGLNYLTHTHPDIMYSVSVLSRYMHSPTMQHLGAAKRVLGYVAGTVDFGLWYSKEAGCSLVGFSDSDWAGNVDDRKNTSGYAFHLGSAAVSWKLEVKEERSSCSIIIQSRVCSCNCSGVPSRVVEKIADGC